MPRVEGFAEIITPEARGGLLHGARQLAREHKQDRGGRTVRDVLEEAGDSGIVKVGVPSDILDELRRLQKRGGDEGLEELVASGWVLVDVRHLRGARPGEPVSLGCSVDWTPDDVRVLGLTRDDPASSAPRVDPS